MRRRRLDGGDCHRVSVRLTPDDKERLEAACLREATRPPFRDIKPSVVAKRAVLLYLEQIEAADALLTDRRARPPCVYARPVGGLRWCPEHDMRWEEGDPVPECCRGDG